MEKFNAKELLESLNREMNQEEINEIYKAIIAYSCGISEITNKIDAKLEEIMDFYFEVDSIRSFINEEVYDYSLEVLNDYIDF